MSRSKLSFVSAGLLTFLFAAASSQTSLAVPLPASHKYQTEAYLKKHNGLMEETHHMRCDLLFVGDSITEYWKTDGAATWQRAYANKHAINIGVAGDTTDDLLWRLNHGEIDGLNPAVSVLMIGTNDISLNAADGVPAKVKQIIDLMLKKMPNTKILLLGIFPRDWQSQSPVRAVVHQTNSQLHKLANGKNVFYLDIGTKLLTREGAITQEVMPDGLHLSAEGYQIWAYAMRPELDRLLAEAHKSTK